MVAPLDGLYSSYTWLRVNIINTLKHFSVPSSAALANETANMACQQYQVSKAGTSQNASLVLQVLTANKLAKMEMDR